MKTALVLLAVEERHREKLEAAGAGCRLIYDSPGTVSPETVQSANIIIGQPAPEMIAASENLEWLQLESAGTDAYIAPCILHEKTVLTNATGAYSVAVAEHAFALTLMLQKKLYLYRDEQAKRRWRDRGGVTSLSDSTVLVMGLGDIGLHYARLAKAMGAYVIGVKRRPSARPDGVDELLTTQDLDSALPRADVVMSVLPGTAATRHIFTDERFARMKDTALFINCGRGSAVSSDVLCRALREHRIQAAAIDVAEAEPLPAESPLWDLENLVITPHVSGGHHLPETFERIVDIAADNLAAYLAGRELRNVVDFATGCRR